jgi:hypothetical protein
MRIAETKPRKPGECPGGALPRFFYLMFNCAYLLIWREFQFGTLNLEGYQDMSVSFPK